MAEVETVIFRDVTHMQKEKMPHVLAHLRVPSSKPSGVIYTLEELQRPAKYKGVTQEGGVGRGKG